MSYRITIEKVESIEVSEHGDYTVIDERPYTDEEVQQANSNWRNSETVNILHRVFGYPPNRMVQKLSNTLILLQEVEELDLVAVIKAINGMA